jgi:hypothetical protein
VAVSTAAAASMAVVVLTDGDKRVREKRDKDEAVESGRLFF